VSIFSPRRKVTAPDGVEWEIYISRFAFPRWRPATYDGLASTGSGTPADLLFFVLEIPLFVFNQIVLPLGRLVVDLPSAAMRGRRTTDVTVEAVCFWPHRVSLVWTTTPNDADIVVSRIAAALARGDEPNPPDARFVGRVEP
jgi:hypothetical protein